jgi:hypothetical protein
MELSPLVTRLNGIADFAGRVFPARDLATAVDYVTSRTPAGTSSAVVFAPRETAEPSHLIGGVRHRVTVVFAAMVCIRYAGNAEAAYEQLDALRQRVMTQLLGWIPADGHSELQFAGGRLAYSAIGVVIWADEFRTQYYLEA